MLPLQTAAISLAHFFNRPMKMTRVFSLLLTLLFFADISPAADTKVDPNLQAGQAALRARDYAAAVAAMDKAISA